MRRTFTALLCLAALGASASSASADSSSLYRGAGPRPGPDILYEPPASAPQFTNSGVWKAPSILVSGTSAYRDGEFLYDDFLYDDHGANSGARDPNDPRTGARAGSSSDDFAQPNGTYTYPTNPAYAGNAADLVEFRVKPLATATAFRITLNTLKDPSLVATTIAIGGNAALPVPWPYHADVSAPAQFFLTVHGTTADLRQAVPPTYPVVDGNLPVSVDMGRRQIEVDVPHTDWNPGGTVRLAAGVGLWDKGANQYLIPQQAADATHPGGAGSLPTPPAFFNVAFRWTTQGLPGSEPLPNVSDLTSTQGEPRWWRDRAQGDALRAGDISNFYANVDFSKLAAQTNDDQLNQPTGIPTSGPMDRILQSHFETEQGLDYSSYCGEAHSCPGEYRGNLQPYAIYVPSKEGASGYGMTLLLHSLGASYNQYLGSRNQSQFGDRGSGSIVITPEGRGTDGWYYDTAGADTFEVWADVAAHYKLDPAWTAITGYSMGGYGTYKFATQFPDLFAKGQPTVGPPALGIWVPPSAPTGGDQTNTYRMLGSLRNIPFLIWDQATDELVPYPGPLAQSRQFDALGYRYIFDTFSPGEHLTLAFNDQYQPAADFLGETRVDRNPAHVTYVVNPTMDFPNDKTTADHAYWLSHLRLRNAGGSAPLGTIDVRSEAFGTGDPKPGPTQTSSGVLTGGNIPAIGYAQTSKSWGATPRTRKADVLDIGATNIRTVTIDAARARVNCHVRLNVTTDGPLTVKLTGCATHKFAARLHVTVRPHSVATGRQTRFVFHVTVRGALGHSRPVRGALVRFDGAKARTGKHGIARIKRTLRHARRYHAVVTAHGYRKARVTVRAHPRSRHDARSRHCPSGRTESRPGSATNICRAPLFIG